MMTNIVFPIHATSRDVAIDAIANQLTMLAALTIGRAEGVEMDARATEGLSDLLAGMAHALNTIVSAMENETVDRAQRTRAHECQEEQAGRRLHEIMGIPYRADFDLGDVASALEAFIAKRDQEAALVMRAAQTLADREAQGSAAPAAPRLTERKPAAQRRRAG